MIANQHIDLSKQTINQSFCSIFYKSQLVPLDPVLIDYTGKLNGCILTLQIHQSYVNLVSREDCQCHLLLPREKTQCITGVDCLLNGEKIELKIEEEKKAQEIANEGKQQGLTTILSTNIINQDYFNIKIGSLSYESILDITIEMEIISTNINSKTYQTIIPFSEDIFSDIFYFSLSIENAIASIELVDSKNKKIYFTFNENVLKLYQKPSGPIVLYTNLSEDIPNMILNDMNDEYSVISVAPHFSQKSLNSDFIFLVDCSASMGGDSIINASECLSVFIHSIPIGCKFGIILFGSKYRSIFKEEGLVDYNEENLRNAEKVANNLKADLHGTELYEPLKEAYEQSEKRSKKGNIVQIFLITDGDIFDKDEVFKLVRKNRSKNQIYSIGIGHGANKTFINELANLSSGSCDFVSKSSMITEKVINLLSLSMAPAMTNISIYANDQETLEIIPNPMTPLFDKKLINIYVKRTQKEIDIEHILITGNIGDEDVEISIDKSIQIPDSSAKKLFSINAIKDYENLYDDLKEKGNNKNELDKIKNRIIELSIDNKIISKFTSYVGVEKEPHKNPIQFSNQELNQHSYLPGLESSILQDLFSKMLNIKCQIKRQKGRRLEKEIANKKSLMNKLNEQYETHSEMEIHLEKEIANKPLLMNKFNEQNEINSEMKIQLELNKTNSTIMCEKERVKEDLIHSEKEKTFKEEFKKPLEKAKRIENDINKRTVEKSLKKIISYQDYDGRWRSSHYDELVNYFDDDNLNDAKENINEFFSSLNTDKDQMDEDMKSTILAILIMHIFFFNDSSKWKLIQLKAIQWLNSKYPKNWETEIEELKARIKTK